MNFGVHYGYMMLDEHFGPNCGVLDVSWIGMNYGFHDQAWFKWVLELNIFNWIKLDELWTLDVIRLDMALCKFYLI